MSLALQNCLLNCGRQAQMIDGSDDDDLIDVYIDYLN